MGVVGKEFVGLCDTLKGICRILHQLELRFLDNATIGGTGQILVENAKTSGKAVE